MASEPAIFWSGDGAAEVVQEVRCPEELGRLVPADDELNGASGRSLDDHYLTPLGRARQDIWLCDIYPHTHLNSAQKAAINEKYLPLAKRHGLPIPNWPDAPTTKPSRARQNEIAAELTQSQADKLILLGDLPIRWFLTRYEPLRTKLSDFGNDTDRYGRAHPMKIEGRDFHVIPLVHPRQAAGLGAHSLEWRKLHIQWEDVASRVLGL